MKNTTHIPKPTTQTHDSNPLLETLVAELVRQHEGKRWLLITQQHDFPCEAAPHDAREDVILDLANAMTCHCATVAIFHKGKRLAPGEVEALETEALDVLGPISRAKAEGKL